MTDAPVYIIGHKNPDTDSICSAIGYAAYKEALGFRGFVPARCGNSNARIDSVLNYFNVELPVFIGDVTPRVRDIMFCDPFVCTPETTLAEALEILENNALRALPVIDEARKVLGQVSIFDFGRHFTPRQTGSNARRRVTCSVNDILKTLRGAPVALFDPDRIEQLYVRVAAMDEQSFLSSSADIPFEQSIIVVGDREDIQYRAIMAGVRLIVVSGNLHVSSDIEQLAKTKRVSIINSPGDSAGTAWLIRAAGKVRSVFKEEQGTRFFSAREKLANVRRLLADAVSPLECVVDDDGKLIGIFSKSDLLKPIRRKLILVDHNELTQAVDGAGEVEIVEVIDHHRLGNPPTTHPILFINKPIGSTCSIVAELFERAGIKPSKSVAGVLMGGIISDTLNLQSPTATPRDGELLSWLAGIAGIEAGELANIMFEAGSTLSAGTPDSVITADCKEYEQGKIKFSISQIEELGFRFFWKKSGDILDALERYRKTNGYFISALLVTDINTQNSLLLIKGDADTIHSITYSAVNKGEVFELPGVVSRKKQLVPYFVNLLHMTAR